MEMGFVVENLKDRRGLGEVIKSQSRTKKKFAKTKTSTRETDTEREREGGGIRRSRYFVGFGINDFWTWAFGWG